MGIARSTPTPRRSLGPNPLPSEFSAAPAPAPEAQPLRLRGMQRELPDPLVQDYRRLGDERDDPHGAMAGRARERDAIGSTSKICCRRAAHRRVASLGARRGAGTIRVAYRLLRARPDAAFRNGIPRGRLASQPSYRVVTALLIPDRTERAAHLSRRTR